MSLGRYRLQGKKALLTCVLSSSSKDDVTLVLYEEGDEEEVLQRVSRVIEELGFDPEKTPDILLVTARLGENEQACFVKAVERVVWFQDLPDSWRRWVIYLGKRFEDLKKVSVET